MLGMGGNHSTLDQIKPRKRLGCALADFRPNRWGHSGRKHTKCNLTFDTSGMATGDYEALLYLRNPTQQPLPIPVLLDVKHLNYFPLLLN